MGRWLNMELLDSTGDPFDRRPYTLRYGDTVREGRTGRDGRLSLEIPEGIDAAVLRVAWREFTLDFSLPPVSEVAGAQARLNQLNYHAGAVDGVLGPRTERALRMFQVSEALPETGALDADTCRKLVEVHGT